MGRPGRTREQLWQFCLANRKVTANGCWEWTRYRDKDGYGRCTFNDYPCNVHRLSAAVNLGFDLDSDMLVLHSCDNPPCFNPAHLFTGTQKANIHDCVRKGRQREVRKTHCAKGHPYLYTNKIGAVRRWRSCVQCKKEYNRNYIRPEHRSSHGADAR